MILFQLDIKERIESEMSIFLAASETCNEFQPKELKWVKSPDHYAIYRDQIQDIGFLGASIAAKVDFVKIYD